MEIYEQDSKWRDLKEEADKLEHEFEEASHHFIETIGDNPAHSDAGNDLQKVDAQRQAIKHELEQHEIAINQATHGTPGDFGSSPPDRQEGITIHRGGVETEPVVEPLVERTEQHEKPKKPLTEAEVRARLEKLGRS